MHIDNPTAGDRSLVAQLMARHLMGQSIVDGPVTGVVFEVTPKMRQAACQHDMVPLFDGETGKPAGQMCRECDLVVG